MSELPSSTTNHRFRALVAESGLSQATSMTLFNRGRSVPVTESRWKAWLAEPGSERWAEISEADLLHADAAPGVATLDRLSQPAGMPPDAQDPGRA